MLLGQRGIFELDPEKWVGFRRLSQLCEEVGQFYIQRMVGEGNNMAFIGDRQM